jgi:4-amino-4-deoxy-L-arabinose transferase-like glycosyltransferase
MIPAKAGWFPRPATELDARRLCFAAWLALCALCLFWNLGGALLYDVDEGAFSEATREMLERHDFLTTYLNGQLRFDKPILIYWLQALSVSLFGLHEWTLRLPSALAASGWLWAIMVFTRRRLDPLTAILAMAFAGTAVGVLIIGRAATADALLNLCLCAALLDAYRYVESGRRAQLLRVYAWMGIGMLTKGPVALVVPCMVTAVYFASTGRIRDWVRAIADPAGWLLLLAIALPWYALEFREQGALFFNGFFMRHNVERFTDPLQGHTGAWFYYIPATLIMVLPHSGLFLRILPFVRSHWRDPLDRFLWIWFAVVLVFFSFAGTKLPHYILYGATPLFILMARHRAVLRSRWLAYGPALALLAVLFALPDLLSWRAPHIRNPYFAQTISAGLGEFGLIYRVTVGAGFAAVAFVAFRHPRDSGLGLAAAGVAVALVLTSAVIPTLSAIQQGPVAAAAQFVSSRTENVVAWGVNVPSFSVYRNAVTPVRRPTAGELALTREDRRSELPPHTVLFSSGALRVVRIDREAQ